MADPLTPAISDRICAHMNDDHAEAVALYARAYAGIETDTAVMQAIDAEAMTIAIGAQTIRIPFDHPLQDSEDAHQTLIAMLRQARQGQG